MTLRIGHLVDMIKAAAVMGVPPVKVPKTIAFRNHVPSPPAQKLGRTPTPTLGHVNTPMQAELEQPIKPKWPKTAVTPDV
jgi:hypothetical protein